MKKIVVLFALMIILCSCNKNKVNKTSDLITDSVIETVLSVGGTIIENDVAMVPDIANSGHIKLNLQDPDNFKILAYKDDLLIYYYLDSLSKSMKIYSVNMENPKRSTFIGEVPDFRLSANPITVSSIGDLLYFAVGTGNLEDFSLQLIKVDCKNNYISSISSEKVTRFLSHVDNIDKKIYLLKGNSVSEEEYISYIESYDTSIETKETIIRKRNFNVLSDVIYYFDCANDSIFLLSLIDGKWFIEVTDFTGTPITSIDASSVQEYFPVDTMPTLQVFEEYVLLKESSISILCVLENDVLKPVMKFNYLGFATPIIIGEENPQEIVLYSHDKSFFILNINDDSMKKIRCSTIPETSKGYITNVYQSKRNIIYEVFTPIERTHEYYTVSLDSINTMPVYEHDLNSSTFCDG